MASVTRGARADKSVLEAAAPESHEAGLSAKVTGEDDRATEALFGLFFIFSFSTIEGGRGSEKDTISASEGGGEATGKVLGDGSESSDGGLDPNQTPKEDDADS